MDHLYIVIWRGTVASTRQWKPQPGGVFETRRLAENLIECLKAAGESWDFAVVEGPIVSAEKEVAK